MFSHIYDKLSFNNISKHLEQTKPSDQQITEVIKRAATFNKLELNDLSILLSEVAWKNHKKLIQQVANNITQQRHGKVIKFYAPLYISNECTNKCVYCGFNIDNKIVRKTLSLNEIIKEAEIIKKMGIEHLLLVSGECNNAVSTNYLAEISSVLSNMFSSLTIEVAPLSHDDYSLLFKNGIEGITCYQETYNPEMYKKCHPAGPKKHITNRLNTLDRAGKAGLRFLGIGSLLGLSDFRAEAVYLAMHARHLEKTYWKSLLQVSFPRIRPCAGIYKPDYEITDENLLQLISVLRLFLPDAVLVLSTRENTSFRDKAIHYGINQLSAGSKTMPSGYSDNQTTNDGQFEIADSRSPAEIANMLSNSNYDPVFKDWDKGFRNSNI